MFMNVLRDADDRSIAKKKMQGWVVEPNDPMQLQRVKVRVHDLHDQIADEDLPWFVPEQMSSSSGAADIGDHGPIPPKGTKVWVMFAEDGSQYHGTYGGGVATTQNQIPEFTKGQQQQLPNGPKYDFTQNYPASTGLVNQSGNFHAVDQKTDVHTNIHVAGTGSATDGRGNHSFYVNGDADRSDNPDAKKVLPTGGTYTIKGNCSLTVTGDLNVTVGGNVNISGGGTVTINGGKVEINSGSPGAASSGAAPQRQRPKPQLQAIDETY